MAERCAFDLFMGLKAFFTCCFTHKDPPWIAETRDFRGGIQNLVHAKLYRYKELQIATAYFSPGNKIGEGGFGSVYKGVLKDGTLVAIKVLSPESRQGMREFLSEIGTISSLEHENLVKLFGCCVEAGHRILVYGYLENNSLAQTLLGDRRYRSSSSIIAFSWETRTKLCIGIARGLAFLHEEAKPHIVHRDIKASNILLDKDLCPKISDFGLAKIFPPELTHISTKVAGTLGYLAPEYAIRGQVTRKADVFSFGILLLEIISGRRHADKRLPIEDQHLVERAWRLYETGDLIQLVDADLEGNFDDDEACRYLKIGLLCTQDDPKERPSMSRVAKLLSGEIYLGDEMITKPKLIAELMEMSQKNISSDSEKGWSTENTTMSFATMSFASIYDRSN